MSKVEVKKTQVTTTAVTITLTETAAGRLMRYLVDGPDWETEPCGDVAEQVFNALEASGIREA